MDDFNDCSSRKKAWNDCTAAPVADHAARTDRSDDPDEELGVCVLAPAAATATTAATAATTTTTTTPSSSKRRPDTEGTAPLPRPRRIPSSSKKTVASVPTTSSCSRAVDHTITHNKQQKTPKTSVQTLEQAQLQLLPREAPPSLSGMRIDESYLFDNTTIPSLPTTSESVGSRPGAFRVAGIGSGGSNHSMTLSMTSSQDNCESPLQQQHPSPRFVIPNNNDNNNDNNHGLLEARPVTEDASGHLSIATPVPQTSATKRRSSTTTTTTTHDRKRRRCLLLYAAIVAAMILISSIVVGLRFGSSNQQQPQQTNDNDDYDQEDPFSYSPAANMLLDILPPASVDRIRHQHKWRLHHTISSTPNNSFGHDEDTNKNTSSPQLCAFDWLVQDPYLWMKNATAAADFDDRILQRFSLATLYFATNGTYWERNSHWLSYEIHECHWFHSTSRFSFLDFSTIQSPCRSLDEDDNDGGVRDINTTDHHYYDSLSLVNNNLQGSLPEELYLLTRLRTLNAYENRQIKGSISSQIGVLSNLQYLNLMRSSLHHSIPSEIGLLGELDTLFLGNNSLVGSLPTEVGQLASLQQVTINGNTGITGSLPTELGLLENLVVAGLQDTSVTGSIPSELGNLHANFRYAYFQRTLLSGTIPTEIGLLQNLAWFHAYSSLISGTIPTQLGRLRSMQELVLSNNTLSGSIPTEIGWMNNLYLLFLSDNQLSGSVPATALAKLTNMKFLDLSHNEMLSGTIPESLLLLEDYAPNVTFVYCNGDMSHCDAINGGRSY